MADLLEMVTMDDLKGESKYLAELVGLEAFKVLVRTYGGTSSLYVPVMGSVIQPVRDELIRREYDGGNVNELAIKWDLTDRRICEIVKDKMQEIKTRPIEGQTSFFDE